VFFNDPGHGLVALVMDRSQVTDLYVDPGLPTDPGELVNQMKGNTNNEKSVDLGHEDTGISKLRFKYS
jgi:hypothetical protein